MRAARRLAAAALALALALALMLQDAAASKVATQRRSVLRRAAARVEDIFRNNPADAVCVTWGDTHVIPFGGAPLFDIMSVLPYLMLRVPNVAKQHRFEVQSRQVHYGTSGVTTDNDFAIRCGLDIFHAYQPRNGQRVRLTMNGRDISVGRNRQQAWPSAPSGGNWYIQDVSYSGWDMYELSCGFEQHSDAYASGFKIKISWHRNGDVRYVFGNSRIEANPRYRGQLTGCCGWASGSHPHQHNWLIRPEDSLFSLTPSDHAREAKEGRKVPEPQHVEPLKQKCRNMVREGTGIDVNNIPARLQRDDKDVKKVLNEYVDGCAIDLFYGAPHNSKDMHEEVCNWIKDVREGISKEMEETANAINTCKKPFVPVTVYERLVDEKFELGKLCNKNNAPKRDEVPKFHDCRAKEAEQEGKRAAEQQAKADEARTKEEKKKVDDRLEQLRKEKAEQEKQHAARAQEEDTKAQTEVDEFKAKHSKDVAKTTGTKIVVRVLNNPVPVCKDCEDAKPKPAEETEESEAGAPEQQPAPNPQQQPPPPPQQQQQQIPTQQAALVAPIIAAIQAIAKTQGPTEATRAAPVIAAAVAKAEVAPQETVKELEEKKPADLPDGEESVKRIKAEGHARSKDIVEAAQKAAAKIPPHVADRAKGEVPPGKKLVWVKDNGPDIKDDPNASKLIVPVKDRKQEASDVKLPQL
jgi:hypothetical protein